VPDSESSRLQWSRQPCIRARLPGFGVTNDGATYHGPYNEAAYSAGFGIGPGVARSPTFIWYEFSVCTGVDRWSSPMRSNGPCTQRHGRDQHVRWAEIMGTRTSSDAIASDNAAKAGIIVVAAAGNARAGTLYQRRPGCGRPMPSVSRRWTRAHFLANGVQSRCPRVAVPNGVEG